jgi:hypothetical protein
MEEENDTKLAPWMNCVDVRVVVGRSKLLAGKSYYLYPSAPHIEVVRHFANTREGTECQCRHFRMELTSGTYRGCWELSIRFPT